MHLQCALHNRVSTYLVLRRAHYLPPLQSCVYISRVEACTFNVPFRIVCLHTSGWGEHILYPLYNRVSTYLVLKHAHSMCPSESCVYIPGTSCWNLHLHCSLHNRVPTYLVLRPAHSLSPSQSCVYISLVEACTFTIPFRIVCLHTWYLILKSAPSISPSESYVYTPRVEATTFTIPFTIVCLHISCWSMHLHYPLQNRVSTYLVPRVEACTFNIPFIIVCLHTSCWGDHLHHPLHNRVSTYLVLRRKPSLSPSKSFVYIPRVEACTFTIPFRIVCLHISCWGEHLLYPLHNSLSTYLVLRPAPSLSPSRSCVYIYRVEASTFPIRFPIVCLHTSCWSLHLHYPLQDRVSIYLVLRPAPSLSPSESCVYIPRVEACTFTIPFRIVCLHTLCWGLHIHYPLQNRVSTYLVLRPAPSLSPSGSCLYIPRVEACTFTIPFTLMCLHTSCWGLPLHYPLHNCVSTYLMLRPVPSIFPSEFCVYIPRVEACTFYIPFIIVCLHTSCWGLHLLYPLQNRVSTYLELRPASSRPASESRVCVRRRWSLSPWAQLVPFRPGCQAWSTPAQRLPATHPAQYLRGMSPVYLYQGGSVPRQLWRRPQHHPHNAIIWQQRI